jgi:hypothetical protein
MRNLTLTTEEIEALVDVVLLGIEEQEQYLIYGNPEVDYAGEWREEAERKATMFQIAGLALLKLGQDELWRRSTKLANDFRESVELV